MAEVLETFEFTDRNGKYPWKQWGDGNIWKLTRGEDYDNYVSLQMAAYQLARRSGRKVQTKTLDGGAVIVIRFLEGGAGDD